MTTLKKMSIGKLFLITLVVGLACGTAQTVQLAAPTQTPQPPQATQSPAAESTPTSPPPTSAPKIRLPDEARAVSEVWRIIMEDFVEIQDVDTRVLSDGGISGLLELSGDTGTSLAEARDLAFDLENTRDYFDVEGGQELREIYEVWAYTFAELKPNGITPSDLNEAAIDGVIEALGDPYTAFLTSDDLRLDQEDLKGSFDGIGAFVGVNDEGHVVVIAPIENTPAEAAGIKAGDTILEVDGEATNTMSLQESILRIRGPKGSDVKLLVKHLLDEEPEIITITRGDIPVSSVGVTMVTDDIARVRIDMFTRRTPEETREALQEVRATDAKAIVLDLRQNPGGLLAETVEVADEFLDGGLVLFEQDGDGRRTDWTARPGGLATEIPLAILVDQFSASGAEVLAGALQDHQRGQLIGTQTFGKGSVTHLRALSDGSGVYVTFARWFTPSGDLIEGEGIVPDIEVPVTEADAAAQRDPQLEAAIEHLQGMIGLDT